MIDSALQFKAELLFLVLCFIKAFFAYGPCKRLASHLDGKFSPYS